MFTPIVLLVASFLLLFIPFSGIPDQNTKILAVIGFILCSIGFDIYEIKKSVKYNYFSKE